MPAPRLLTHKGVSDTVYGWAKRTGLSQQTILKRLASGWSQKDALTLSRNERRSDKPYTRKAQPIKAKVSEPIAQLLRANMASQREMTRTLRQFNRDLMLIMERNVVRGVVENFSKTLPDRTLSVPLDRG